jgi:hypothetical protein
MPLTAGCDSRAILAEHGFAAEEIDALAREGVIGGAQPDETSGMTGTNG